MKRNEAATCGDGCPYWECAILPEQDEFCPGDCKRFPVTVEKEPDDWCWEHPEILGPVLPALATPTPALLPSHPRFGDLYFAKAGSRSIYRDGEWHAD